ncbi:MAG: ABC transporter substrate-binding protein [Anaerolineae bacterium]
MAQRLFAILFVLLFTTIFATPAWTQEAPSETADTCVEQYDASTDYFPDKAEPEFTAGFSVEYFNNYKLVTVLTPYPGAEETFQYALVQCGTPIPDDLPENALVVEVPVQSVVTMSTTYLPTLDLLGVTDRIVGMDEFDYVNTPSVRERIDAGELVEIGSGSGVNVEALLELEPGLVMTQSFGSPDYDAAPVLVDAGLPVVINGDWVDTTPLGRAEWMKFIALFFNGEAVVNEAFAGVVERYNALAEMTAAVETQPTVFVGSAYGDTWYMAGGASYAAQLLRDAGAAYVNADDTSTGGLPLDFETAYDIALEADFWLNPDQLFWFTLDDVSAADPRYEDFAAFQSGNIYNNNAIMNEFGGVDYYESGLSNPDVILADLITIFHPDLLPDHQLVYYQRLG